MKLFSSSSAFSFLLLCIVLQLFASAIFISAQTTTTTTTTATTTSTSTTTTTTTTKAPTTPAPAATSDEIKYNLFAEDKETYSNSIAMSIAAGIVSGLSGNPISVMFTIRTNMVLSMCFPPVEERVAVMQFPFLQTFGTEPVVSRYVATALYNTAAMIAIVIGVVCTAFIMKSAKGYSLERAFHKLRFPGGLFAVVILLGGPALYCGAAVVTTATQTLNVIIGLIALIFWAIVAILLPIIVGRVFDAEYIITQSVESAEQEKLLALSGKKEEVDSADSRSNGSAEAPEENDGVREPDATVDEGAFSGLFSKLRTGIEGIRDSTLENARTDGAAGAAALKKGGGDDDLPDADAELKDQQAEDMRQLAASTVDVLRQMFHHVKRTGGDEEKLLAAVHGTGEWRDKKSEEDFLEEEDLEKEGDEEPLSFMARYGIFFELYNKRNRFQGFVELFVTFACCAICAFFFFPDTHDNCMFQSFTFLAVQFIMWFVNFRRRPYIARVNHGYAMVMLVMHFLCALFLAIGAAARVQGILLTGYIFGICSVYICAFRALFDLYLVVVSKISANRETWPAIQELTDLFLAAKDRRDKGQMLTGPEMTSDKASARSGRSARSAASRRSVRFKQQFGKNGLQLFFKMATDSDRFSASRAIPEEYHPFIMRPLPEQIVLVPEHRRAALREKREAAAAKAKWEAALNQLSLEQGLANDASKAISAAEQFADGEFDEDAAEKKRQEERKKKEAEQKTVPKLVRELFMMGLQTKFEEADRTDLEMTKLDDILYRDPDSPRAKWRRMESDQRDALKQRALLLESNKKKKKEEDEKAKQDEEAGRKKKLKADEEVDEAFTSWIKPDNSALAAQAILEQQEEQKRLLLEQQKQDEEVISKGYKPGGAAQRRQQHLAELKKKEEEQAAAAAAAAANPPTPTSPTSTRTSNNNNSGTAGKEVKRKFEDADDLL